MLVCCYFFSSTAYAQATNPNNCPNTYTGSATVYDSYNANDYSNTVICNTIQLKNLVDSTIINLEEPVDSQGNPLTLYDPSTDTLTFTQQAGLSVTAKATFAINAALQAAGVGLEFRGMKYEWEIYKPSASSELKVTVRIKSNDTTGLVANGIVYSATHTYTGTAFTDWTLQDDGGAGEPPFAFVIQDEWTVEAEAQNNDPQNAIRNMKFTFSYAPKIGHEDDFDPNYVYPGQEQQDTTTPPQQEDQQTSFEEQCEIDPQFSPGCADYQDPNIDDGDDFDPITGIQDDNDLQEELANAGLDNMISDSALQTGTNADGSLSSAIIDTGADIQDGSHGGQQDGQIDGTMPDMPENTVSVIMIVDEDGGPLGDEQLMQIDEVMHDTLHDLNELPGGLDPTSDVVQDALQDALDEIGGTIEIVEMPEAELIAIDEQLQDLSGPMDTTTGGPLMHEDGQMKGSEISPESEPLPIEVEGDISSEISESGEVAIEVDGTLSNIPDEPQMEESQEIIEIDPVDTAIDSPIEEATVVSETGTISETATVSVAKPSLSVTQKRALSVASATTAAAIEVAGQQAYASTTSGIEQSQSGSSLDAQGSSSNSGSSTGNSVDGTPSSGSDSGMSFGNSGSSSGMDTGGANTTANNNNSGNFNIEQNNDTGPQTALGQSTSSTGDVEIASIIADSSISSLNQSGPSGVFESENVTNQVETGEELAQGGAVSYEETNETMFGTIVIPQLDFTVREMIDAVIRKTLVDAGLESEFLSLDEVSEEDLKAQQDLEDKLVEEAIAGSTSEDANAAYLGYNPTFRDYIAPQVYGDGAQAFYAPKTIYPNNTNYDHPNQRFFNGASDVKHRALVRMQYEN